MQLCDTNKADCCSVTGGGTAARLSGGCVLVIVSTPRSPCFFGKGWKNTSALLGHKKSCGLSDRICVFSHNIQRSKHYIYFDKARQTPAVYHILSYCLEALAAHRQSCSSGRDAVPSYLSCRKGATGKPMPLLALKRARTHFKCEVG